MRQFRGFVMGVCFTLLAVGLAVAAGAKNEKVMQELTYRDIRVSLDGEILDLRNAIGEPVEPFMFGGTNYLPVRALAEALGLNVSWDGAEVMVVLTSPSPEPEPEASPEPEQLEEPEPEAAPEPEQLEEPEPEAAPEPSETPIPDTLPEAWAARYPMTEVPLSMPIYVTPTGKHWHFSGTCNGGKYTIATYETALKRGLTPCDKCVLKQG